MISIGRAADKGSFLRRLDLGGNWQVSATGKEDWFPATVPGNIYTDLLAANRIPDPFYRDNEKSVQWVAHTGWIYRRTFDVPVEVLKNDRVLLRCEGLDTVASIKVNGTNVGQTDNMFRLWEFDVKPVLSVGANTIEVTFTSPYDYIKAHESDTAPAKFVRERAWIRKEPCSFGWDWGPVLPGCGIWEKISLETFNAGRMTDVSVQQDLSDKHNAVLSVEIAAETVPTAKMPLTALTAVFDGKKLICKKEVELTGNKCEARLVIPNPKLWWPAGMGGQPLYEVRVELRDASRQPVDSTARRIGLRTLKIYQAAEDHPLYFEVNGVPFFAKGANCIPLDMFPNRVPADKPRRFVADAVAVNMNMLRFWGGGHYENDAWFDACDELGICVWLDFKFACAAYPAFDEKFMDDVRLEARDNLLRLRHHPCIAVWCGNNEISLSWWKGPTWAPNRMSDADYDQLFKNLLAEQVRQFAPQANYVSGSPDCGDTHYWDVWHGPKSFESYRTQSGFMSEFGWQSFPGLKTIRAFTNETDRASVVTEVMKWHQRSGGENCNQKMVDMIQRYFQPPKDFEMTLQLSQMLQGFGIKLGAEYWRQIRPKATGCIFWQYNDIWPGMSWSSVDYFGRWKALHYLARKFYSPVLVSAAENASTRSADLFISSDLMTDQHGKLEWSVTDLSGGVLAEDSMPVSVPAQKSVQVKTLDLEQPVQSHGTGGFLTWLKLDLGGKTVSENLVLLAPPKEFKLLNPELTVITTAHGEEFVVAVHAKKTALWAWLELQNADARFSDNYFHLRPDEPQKIQVRPSARMSHEEFISGLQVRSLYDTYL
ncbi:MAG TPA: glycoside hydrolase family 2 protein [Candidatus Acidoferrales bacterium]|nr:glycoside hydrolase family 2 protein [Candidatus Acidoferrales bacterium]